MGVNIPCNGYFPASPLSHAPRLFRSFNRWITCDYLKVSTSDRAKTDLGQLLKIMIPVKWVSARIERDAETP